MPAKKPVVALPSVPYTFRLQLNIVDAGVYQDATVTAARHPSETLEHLYLRALAYALLYTDGIEIGPGLSDGDAADVWAKDPTGEVTLWVECGASDPQKTDRIANQNPRARVVLLTSNERREQEFLDEALKMKARRLSRLELWAVPAELLAALQSQETRRAQWSVTLSDGQLYLNVGGTDYDVTLRIRRGDEALVPTER